MTGGLEMREVRNAVMDVMNAMASQNQSALQQARQEAIMLIAEVQQISRSEARQELNNYEQEMTELYNSVSQQASQTVDTVQREATQAVDVAATDISQAAWASFIALLLGAIAAWFGGTAGTRKTA